MLANKIAYADAEQFGTPDAMRIGRLHTYDDAWADSMIGFMESGGCRSPPPFPLPFPPRVSLRWPLALHFFAPFTGALCAQAVDAGRGG